MQVPYINLGLQHRDIKDQILQSIGGILDSGQFILGDELSRFEQAFAQLSGARFALGVANGTDALFLPLIAWGIGEGDEVITAPNSFLASASSAVLAGAKPVFADVRSDLNIDPSLVEKAITSRTKAIAPVHLTGRPADMDAILEIAQRHNLKVLEDCAQAVGARHRGRPVGSMGHAGAFSLHPLKNLAACGDGGVITTNDEALYERLKVARNHGLRNRDECSFWSYNSRLDNLQAAILNVKLTQLDKWTARRRQIAEYYTSQFQGLDLIAPQDKGHEHSVYHTYIIQAPRRDELKQYLADHGVDSKVHYPIAIHLQEAAKGLGHKLGDFPMAEQQMKTILSLPVYPELTDGQIELVASTVRKFYQP
jgi:dTDP-4-amino-4,6-dideoxygalactose transaminase